ncbi:MAG: peptide-methionine (S)-S-oxide reductase MsrA, partial [Xanthomonadales bacterium]|nr:peptide-methionine (S)-S-oxide reductase MsrA [Xanthomonadales bacterium]
MKKSSKWALTALWMLVLGLPAQADEAVFAGGCFWCMEEAFEQVEGVSEVISGYAGGHLEDPGYRQVVSGRSGHAEVVKVVYDPDVVSYRDLLQEFWLNIDPTVRNRQFCDSGNQYRTAIFAVDEAQLELAEASKVAVHAQKPFDGPIETEIAE